MGSYISLALNMLNSIEHFEYEKENKVEVSTRLSFLSCLGNLMDNKDYHQYC